MIANFIPILSAIAWLLTWWSLGQFPKGYLIIDGVMAVFCLVAALIISAKAKEKRWWEAALLPLVMNIVVLGYLMIISNQFLIQFIVLLLVVLNYVYWRFVYFYYNLPSRYTSFSLENLSFYVNFLNIFFLGALGYGLRSFLQPKLWMIIAGVTAVLALILYQGMWANKVDWKKYGAYWLVFLLVLIQFFGVLLFLPLNHNLLGFLWASIYYLLLILFNDLISHRFSRKRFRFYFIIVAVGWLILLLSASWL
jgi:hypothetical protein